MGVVSCILWAWYSSGMSTFGRGGQQWTGIGGEGGWLGSHKWF